MKRVELLAVVLLGLLGVSNPFVVGAPNVVVVDDDDILRLKSQDELWRRWTNETRRLLEVGP